MAPTIERDGIERVCVLGAGVMGSQIAALLANAGLEVDLLDLPDGGDAAGLARAGIAALSSRRPPALFEPRLADRIHPGSLIDPGAALARADWIIEAVVEELDTKVQLFGGFRDLVPDSAVLSTNTSGLSIASLADGLDADLARRFLGIHFFNPPRYMKLVELIRAPTTEPTVASAMADFVGQRLGKGVVECRDTPNFIANRLGVFAIMDALHRMAAEGLSVDAVDAVTGVVLGRPRSATLRLCDLIGLDTLVHVAGTAHAALTDDPWREVFATPSVVATMLAGGRLGEKSGGGFYRKGEAGIEALDPTRGEYAARQEVSLALPTRGRLEERLQAVVAAAEEEPLARFAREHLYATLAYCAACAPQVADRLEDVDRALRWGFNWEAGPFETLDLLGPRTVVAGLEASGQAVPELLGQLASAEERRVYVRVDGEDRVLQPDGTAHRRLQPSGPPTDAELLAGGEVMMESDTARLVYLGDGAAAVVFGGKLNVLTASSLALARQAIEEKAFALLVLTGAGDHFSAGADLKYVYGLITTAAWDELEGYVRAFQEATTAVRFASVPVVAAARGLTLGGGCELCLCADGRVTAAELRLGLVEAKVGLIPGAGGCKEMVRRFGADTDRFVPHLAAGTMTDNALQARSLGFLEADDDVRLDGERLLAPAIARARQLTEGEWEPPRPTPLAVAGPAVLERLRRSLAERHAAGEITAHDVVVGEALAHVVCGGGAEGPITEERLLELEREAFLRLCASAETQARIAHMLETGKPLNN